MHKFYFKYFHYKSFQHYVIASNRQYHIIQRFCKFLKRNTDTSSVLHPHLKAFSKANVRNNFHETIPKPAIPHYL